MALVATTHCPRCGGRLEPRQAGHVLRCPTCGRDQFPRSDPAVIMIVTDGEPGTPEERCLLGRSPAWPPGRYSTLAGFVEPGETMEDAVRREVHEETGVRVGEVAYFGSQPWPLPASLMIGFTGRATHTEIDVDGSEIEDARWFTREQMREEAEAEDAGAARRGLDLALADRALVRRAAARPLVRAVLLVLEGHHLPGLRVRLARRRARRRAARREPAHLVPGDAEHARWDLEIQVVPGEVRDFRGPAVQGRRGARFVYLTVG